MVKAEDSSPGSAGKNKRIEEEPIFDEVVSKPLQLQRRRVWRACECCRYASFPLICAHRNLTFLLFCVGEKRSNAMDVSPHASNAYNLGRNALGCRLKIVPH